MKVHFAPKYFMNPTHKITISVIGVGGNGTQALHDLAKINSSLIALGHPGLMVYAIDDDIVEQPNVGRQKFSNMDLSQYKASVIVTRLNRFYGTDWKSIPEKFDGDKWEGTNIIISCVDNVKTRIEIEDVFISLKNNNDFQTPYYWLDFGNSKDYGQFVLGSKVIKQPESKHETTNVLRNVIELFPDMEKNEDINESSCSTREALSKQNLFINSVLVSTGMNLIWELLHSYVIGTHGGYVNLTSCQTKPMKL